MSAEERYEPRDNACAAEAAATGVPHKRIKIKLAGLTLFDQFKAQEKV
jgi:hypothetical protein